MEDPKHEKIPLTSGQRLLLRLVYVLGGVLVLMFLFVIGVIIYQVAHLQ